MRPVLFRWQVAADRRMARVPTSQEDFAGRCTDRCTRVELRQAHPFSRETIDVRCTDLGLPVAAELAPSEIVGDDEDDVRTARDATFSGRTTRPSKRAREDERGYDRQSLAHGRLV